jgi:hypothetical protein
MDSYCNFSSTCVINFIINLCLVLLIDLERSIQKFSSKIFCFEKSLKISRELTLPEKGAFVQAPNPHLYRVWSMYKANGTNK